MLCVFQFQCVYICSMFYCSAIPSERHLTRNTFKWVSYFHTYTHYNTTHKTKSLTLSLSPSLSPSLSLPLSFSLSPSLSLPLSFSLPCFLLPLPEPLFVSLSHTHVVAASHSAVFVWHYRTASRLAMTELTNLSKRSWEGQEM